MGENPLSKEAKTNNRRQLINSTADGFDSRRMEVACGRKHLTLGETMNSGLSSFHVMK